MLKKNLAIAIATLVLASGCATAGSDFTTAWEAADAKRKEAAAIGYEWRDTGKFLDQAKKAADAGDNEKAMKLVSKALEESSDAIAQHDRETTAWESRVPQ